MSATYSPEDNKLRLSSASRLPTELYARVREAGFIWAPRQEIFVAPMWTPGREDLLIELCGEIGDEDTSLVDRAEERAERFENYSVKRAAEASAAHAAVSSIAGRFEFGQPILVGHHSERSARKDKERMDNHMRKAVKMWDTSTYWVDRAAGALAHAKYKELPAVRARRIKGIESDLRRQERSIADAESGMALWKLSGLTQEIAERIASAQRVTILKQGTTDYVSLYSLLTAREISVENAAARSIKAFERSIARASRWANHYKNRIAYENAMLAEGGGLKANNFDIKPGGRVLVHGEWLVVVKVNKVGGRINSVSTNARFVRVKPIEDIKDYRDATPEEAAAVKKATTLPPLCNYPGAGFHEMTKAEWDATHTDYKGSRQLGEGSQRMTPGTGRPDIKAEEGAPVVGRHRVRTIVHRSRLVPVFVTDVKRKDPPAAAAEPAAPVVLPIERDVSTAVRPVYQPAPKNDFDAMRDVLRAGGVQTVVAPELFPTPDVLADRVVMEAGIQPGNLVLEPSAGTGALLHAVDRGLSPARAQVVAVEVNAKLIAGINQALPDVTTICGDFLRCDTRDLGKFDAIVMNPPFGQAMDIAHVRHALTFLRSGGRLVAICANGPRQQAALKPLADASGGFYEPLPAGSFKDAGTNVNTALVVIVGE
jgi:predicted RNA methylase